MVNQCPVCNSVNMSISNFSSSLVRCEDCQALINERAYNRLTTTPLSELQDTDFYHPSDDIDADGHLKQIAIYENILDILVANGASLRSDAVFLDFGAGRGYAAMAAARRCRLSIICDMHTDVSKAILNSLKITDVIVIDDITNAPCKVDVVFMWHVLEHFPNPTAFWIENRKMLSDRAEFIIQVPMYRPDYVVDAHFVFFNEQSIRTWFDKVGANVRKVLFDGPNNFMTVIGDLH